MQFVICDNNAHYKKRIIDTVEKVMFQTNFNYEIVSFNDYNEEFYLNMKTTKPKIYILDIVVNSESGINMARNIRKTDYDSQIILITQYNSMVYELIGENLLINTIISKHSDYEAKLKETLEKILEHSNRKVFLYKTNKFELNLFEEDINCFIYNKTDRNITIYTKDNDYIIKGPLRKIKEQLSKKFKYSHQSCIINEENVEKIDYTNKKIIFKNSKVINLLSRKYFEDAIKN